MMFCRLLPAFVLLSLLLAEVKSTGTCTTDDDCVSGETCTGTPGSKTCTACNTAVSTANGDLCDPKTGLIGAACSTSSPCTTSNSECIGNTKCTCKSGYTANYATFSCQPNLGTTCTPTSSQACDGADSVCDPYSNICKVKDTASCAATNADKCTTGATCSTGTPTCGCAAATPAATQGYCQKKIATGAACSWYDTCTDANAVCDLQLGKCAKKESFDCTASDTCVSGATCSTTTNKCACGTGYTPTNNLCVAAAGKAGGACTSGTCTDTNAECKTTPNYGAVSTTTACYCKANFQFNPSDGKCISSSASSMSKMTAFVTVMAALYLGFHL